MHKFVRNLITEWRQLKLPIRGETVVVAISGGADSVSLLLAIDDLKQRGKLDLRIVAAHFNHKLRPEASDRDLDHVREITVARHIELATGEWRRATSGNLEQDARWARYEFLQKTAENVKSRFVLTGHTMNDQAETVLMNLIRGSGVDGLGGMRFVREIPIKSSYTVRPSTETEPLLPFPEPSPSLARPLLKWSKREDTENFCRDNKVEFLLDPMNEETTFRRVWIRKVVIPMLQEVNPKIVDSLCRTAELLQHRSVAARAVEGFGIDLKLPSIPLSELKQLDAANLRDSLRTWIRGNRGNLRGLQLKHIEAVERLVHSQKSGKVAELPGGAIVVKESGRLVYGEIRVDN
jgi:tRNA(Ile)-lysidine synthetase, N-terminal domain